MSTSYEQPYHRVRRLSTVDDLFRGWQVSEQEIPNHRLLTRHYQAGIECKSNS